MNKIDTKINHITPAGGNVFADLGFEPTEAQILKEHADTLLQTKLGLMNAVSDWIEQNHLKQSEAAEILGITRPRVSDVVNNKATKFTIDALVLMLSKTGKSVQLSIV